MQLTFYGAAQNVTGSRFLLESNGTKILIDCGLFQERELLERNWNPFPVKPAEIQTILLTHAHIDHCGYLPRLVKEGFKGRIICTPPSVEIAKISLLDSAKLQEHDAEQKRRRHIKEKRTGPYPELPLYTADDVPPVFPLFKPVPYEQAIPVNDSITARFFDAGHILGAAMIELKVKEAGAEKTIVFSGDIGRWGRPILRDPHLFSRADVVIMEGTYGSRTHPREDSSLEKLKSVITSTHKAGGNVVIPTFAIGRTQELLYDLNRLLNEDQIPHLMTFVDSPMAMNITRIFEDYPDYFDQETKESLAKYKELFDFPLLKFTPSQRESKAINHIKGSVIIMAGSGMCTGGRIKHHLANNISRPESAVLFVGYQARGTLGRHILERPKSARILGQNFKVRCRIEKINGFSAHADQTELLKWAGAFQPSPKKIYVVHAEKDTAIAFSKHLSRQLNTPTHAPVYGESVVI